MPGSSPRPHSGGAALALWLGLFACSDGQGIVRITVTLPAHGSPGAAELVLTRYDIPGLADSVAATAVVPKPDFSALEREMEAFEPTILGDADSLQAEWRSIRSEIVRLADSLSAVSRESQGYAAAYGRLRALHAEVTEAETALERRMSRLVPPEARDLARRARIAADSLRAWEATASAGLPALLDSLAAIHGPPVVVPVPADGQIELRLATGDWWAAMRMPHPTNPFLEYYWRGSFRLNRAVPLSVPLDERLMTVRWRH